MQTNGLKKIAVVDSLKMPKIKAQLCINDIAYMDLFLGTQFDDFMQASPVLFEVDSLDATMLNQCLAQKSAIVLETTLSLPVLQKQLTSLLTVMHWKNGEVYLRWYSPSVMRSLYEQHALLLAQLPRIYVPNYALTQWDTLTFEQGNEWILFPLDRHWDPIVEQCRLRYWLGVRKEWQAQINLVESTAALLQKVAQSHELSQLQLVAWSTWLASQTQYLNHPQFIEICLQSVGLQEIQSQVKAWLESLSKEMNNV